MSRKAALITCLAIALVSLAAGITAFIVVETSPKSVPHYTDQQYNDWLFRETTVLKNDGIPVLESLYLDGKHDQISIRLWYMDDHGQAKNWCLNVAYDYVEHFGQSVTVRFFGPAGKDDERASCTKGP